MHEVTIFREKKLSVSPG